jgi:hypothetical protein
MEFVATTPRKARPPLSNRGERLPQGVHIALELAPMAAEAVPGAHKAHPGMEPDVK